MALLDEKNLAGEAARRARFRVHHVGTKLRKWCEEMVEEMVEMVDSLICVIFEVKIRRTGSAASPR